MNYETKLKVLDALAKKEKSAMEAYEGALQFKNFRKAEAHLYRVEACHSVAKLVEKIKVQPGENAMQRAKDRIILSLTSQCAAMDSTENGVQYVQTAKVLSEILELLIEESFFATQAEAS